MATPDNIDAYPRFHDTVARRYSCRSYSPAPVPREMLLAVLDTARLAPSACNRQPWHFTIAESEEARAAVCEAYSREWVRTARAFIIITGDHAQAWHRQDGKDATDIDIAIAAEHICLAATSLGLATCWICNFDAPAISRMLSLPSDIEPIVIIPIGYPADPEGKIPAKTRKNLTDLIDYV